MSELNPTPFKKRITQKIDRKLSPLNPQAAVLRESESPPVSPHSLSSFFSAGLNQ
ncbi:hypothetical protein HDU91_001655, partial [Kappamyces sp. JEL0680]